MTPTPKLRFIQRDGPMMGFHKNSDGSETTMRQQIRILQQWWAPFRKFHDGYGYAEQELKGGEWRDVPLEAE